MPKNTKTKKSSKSVNRFSIKSPKQRMIALVVAFALVGGGLMVYRSFALVGVWGYGPGKNGYELSARKDPGQPINPCSALPDHDASFGKGGTDVVKLSCAANTAGAGARATIKAKNARLVSDPKSPASVNHDYRGCVTYKGTGSIILILSSQTEKNYTSLNRNLNSPSAYATLCTNNLYITEAGDLTLSAAAFVEQGKGKTELLVPDVTLQRIN